MLIYNSYGINTKIHIKGISFPILYALHAMLRGYHPSCRFGTDMFRYVFLLWYYDFRSIVFNATFQQYFRYIVASVLLVEETGVPRENH